MLKGINAGSGQRPFTSTDGIEWINVDCNPKWKPDFIANWNDLRMFYDQTMDYVVAHHTLEHVGCGEGIPFIREAHRILKKGGSLLVFVPDMRALCQRWLTHQLDTQIFLTNVYGAYMGDEADRHKWGFDGESLHRLLKKEAGIKWYDVHAFNWRMIPGADVSRDWWILGLEAIKEKE